MFPCMYIVCIVEPEIQGGGGGGFSSQSPLVSTPMHNNYGDLCIIIMITLGDVYSQTVLDSYDVSVIPLLSSKEPRSKVGITSYVKISDQSQGS